MRHAHPARRTSRKTIVLTAAAAVVGAALVVVPTAPSASAAGTALLNESFTGTSVSDPNVKPLGDACLTRATSAPPTGSSTLGMCDSSKRTDAPGTSTNPGWMMLTGNENNRTGGIVYNQALPASAGLTVTFDQAQYSNTDEGADGISFFLSDGAYNLTTTGASGGSLGYAQKIGTTVDGPGVVGGFLGLALDAWGNFPRSNEGRGTGCSAAGQNPGDGTASDRIKNSVTLRGPGWQDGTGAWTQGYCLLATQQLPTSQNLRANATSANTYRTVRITVYPTTYSGTTPSTRITVEVNFTPGTSSTFTTVLDTTTNEDVPDTYKFGFAASTGGSKDVHLIRNLQVSTVEPLAALTLTKSVNTTSPLAKTEYAEGDQVPYTFTLTNGGAYAINPVAINDPLVTSISCPATSLKPAGQPGSSITCTGTHTVTAAEAGSPTLTNTAIASGTANGTPLTSTDSATVNLVTPDPKYDFTKTATWHDVNGNGLHDAGDSVSYQFSVHNTGNVTLAPVTITDAKLGLTDWQCLASIAPGATQTCDAPAAYTVKESDVIHGSVDNTATATAKRAGSNDPITRTASATQPTVPAVASITHVKSAEVKTPGGATRVGAAHLGDIVHYSFTVRNTGNVTIPTVTINDPGLGVSGLVCATDLAPGAEHTCTTTATHTIDEDDIVAGHATNTATATVTPPTGVTAPPPTPSTSTPPTVPAEAQLSLEKTATLADTNANSSADAGEVITYGFTVTNLSNVTVHDVAVTDPMFSGLTCTSTTLAPGASTTCGTRTHTVTEADVLHGSVDNTATASAKAPSGVTDPPDVTDSANVATTAASAKVFVVKHATLSTDTNGNGKGDVGDKVSYSFDITNTGNVTLHDLTVNDPMLGGTVACSSITSLAPGASATCSPTATHTVTQADLVDNTDHLLHNTATVSGKNPSDATVTSGPSSATVPLAAAVPALSIDKTHTLSTDVNGNGQADLGDTVSYSFRVTNTGNVTLTDVVVTDTKLDVTVTAPGNLAPGAHVDLTATATHEITEADILAGEYKNTAKANADSAAGPAPEATDTDTVGPVPPAGGLKLTKHATLDDANGNGKADLGETISYSFDVENTGNVTLAPVVVDDPTLGITGLQCAASLAPGDTEHCSTPVTREVKETDIVTRAITNTATATGTVPPAAGGGDVTDDDTVTTPPAAVATSLELTKKASVADTNGSGATDAGDVVTYSFEVKNTGNVTLQAVMITDAMLGLTSVPCTTDLAPGDTVTCTATGTYTLTEGDVLAHGVTNTATATGIRTGQPPATDTDTKTVTTAAPAPGITLTKTAHLVDGTGGTAGKADLGEHIQYSFTVKNTGNVSLGNVTVSDPSLGTIACADTTLAVGATTTCTGLDHVTTEADLLHGSVDNTATASADPAGGLPSVSDDDSATVPAAAPAPDMTFVKNATVTDTNANGITDAGDVIHYSFTVTNTGNVTLSSVTITDPTLHLTNVSCATNLAPGGEVTCSTPATHTIDESDIVAGSVVNHATATGTPPAGGGDPVTKTSTKTVEPTEPVKGIELTKSVKHIDDNDGDSTVSPGDVVAYTFHVKNTGNVTLAPVTVTDTLLTGTPFQCVATLAPGAEADCDAPDTYTVVESDILAGKIVNTATARGTAPGSLGTTSDDDTNTLITQAATAGVTLHKAATVTDVNGNQLVDAGDTIAYLFQVINDGTVTLAPVTITDTALGLDGWQCAASLAPHATTICQAPASTRRTITEQDLVTGHVDNTATAKGDAPGSIEDPTSTDTATVTTATAVASLTLTKSATVTDTNGNDETDAGDVIHYSFAVKNTGTVTLDPVTLDDDLLHLPGYDCGLTLAPGASGTCTGTFDHTVTELDMVAGQVVNHATAHGTPTVSVPPAIGTDTKTLDVEDADTKINLVKTVVWDDVNSTQAVDADDTLTYTLTVKNTGNVTLTNVGVDDPMINPVTCQDTTLAPQATTTCSGAVHTVTEADVIAGHVQNHATASGTGPGTTGTVTDDDSVDTPTATKTAAMTLVKKATVTDVNNNGKTDVGDTIAYEFTVTNTGTLTLAPVTVKDATLGITGLQCATSLKPGKSVTCPAGVTRTIDEADLVALGVDNHATATGVPPAQSGLPDATDDDDAHVQTTPPVSQLTLTKTAHLADVNGNNLADVGEKITYTLVVKNVGNVTVHDLAVSDPLIAPVTCEATSLAPGAETSCSGATYTVKAADILAGTVHNEATASAKAPATVTDPQPAAATADVPTAQPNASLVIVKTSTVEDVDHDGTTSEHDLIHYSFRVTNNGNVDLTNVVVDDPTLGVSGLVCAAALAVGDHADCDAGITHEVTQADLIAGKVTNTATATGETPPGVTPPEPAKSTIDTPTTPAVPGLDIVKKATLHDDGPGAAKDNGLADVGETITYEFTVTNTGNVTLRKVTVDDSLLKVSGLECATDLEPGASATCQAPDPYTVTEADLIEGKIVNTATGHATTPPGVDEPTPPTDDVTVPATKARADLTLVKHADLDDKNENGKADAGEKIAYSFTATNTGNVTLPKVTVTDKLLGVKDLACATDLKPGASVTCRAPEPYTVTEADVVAGSVVNAATATATTPPGVTPPGKVPSSTTTSTSKVDASLSLKKTGTLKDKNGDGKAQPGETIRYTFLVTNTGNVTLHSVTIADKKLGSVSCPAKDLAPGASVTCHGDEPYTVTEADAKAGKVTNTAVASATGPGNVGEVSSSESTATTAASAAKGDPKDPGTGTLPWTGVDVRSALGFALLQLAAGAALVVVRRRRRA